MILICDEYKKENSTFVFFVSAIISVEGTEIIMCTLTEEIIINSLAFECYSSICKEC